MGGFAKTVRRVLTPPKWARRMLTPPGGSDWIKEYEVGPKLAAFTAALATGNPFIGAGVGSMITGTTETGKALAEGRPWYEGTLKGGVEGFGIGGGGGFVGAKAGLPNIGTSAGVPTPWGARDKYGIPINAPTYAEATAPGGVAGAPGTAKAAGIDYSKMIGPALATGAGALSIGATPPEFEVSTAAERLEKARESVLAKYMGDESAQLLPKVAAAEYLKQIQTPLGELYPVERDARWGRVQPLINKSWDDYESAINAKYAHARGTGSSEHKKELQDARRLRTQELSQSRQEIEQGAFEMQVKIKQDALMRAAQQGQFDEKLALEMAKLIGEEETLAMSMEMQDYDTFQRVMGQIMSIGYEMAMPQASGFRG